MREYLVLFEVVAGKYPNDHGFEVKHVVWAATADDAARTVDTAYLYLSVHYSPGTSVGRVVGVMRVIPEGANEPRL